jgi:hypothetical protein
MMPQWESLQQREERMAKEKNTTPRNSVLLPAAILATQGAWWFTLLDARERINIFKLKTMLQRQTKKPKGRRGGVSSEDRVDNLGDIVKWMACGKMNAYDPKGYFRRAEFELLKEFPCAFSDRELWDQVRLIEPMVSGWISGSENVKQIDLPACSGPHVEDPLITAYTKEYLKEDVHTLEGAVAEMVTAHAKGDFEGDVHALEGVVAETVTAHAKEDFEGDMHDLEEDLHALERVVARRLATGFANVCDEEFTRIQDGEVAKRGVGDALLEEMEMTWLTTTNWGGFAIRLAMFWKGTDDLSGNCPDFDAVTKIIETSLHWLQKVAPNWHEMTDPDVVNYPAFRVKFSEANGEERSLVLDTIFHWLRNPKDTYDPSGKFGLIDSTFSEALKNTINERANAIESEFFLSGDKYVSSVKKFKKRAAKKSMKSSQVEQDTTGAQEMATKNSAKEGITPRATSTKRKQANKDTGALKETKRRKKNEEGLAVAASSPPPQKRSSTKRKRAAKTKEGVAGKEHAINGEQQVLDTEEAHLQRMDGGRRLGSEDARRDQLYIEQESSRRKHCMERILLWLMNPCNINDPTGEFNLVQSRFMPNPNIMFQTVEGRAADMEVQIHALRTEGGHLWYARKHPSVYNHHENPVCVTPPNNDYDAWGLVPRQQQHALATMTSPSYRPRVTPVGPSSPLLTAGIGAELLKHFFMCAVAQPPIHSPLQGTLPVTSYR